MKKRSAFTETGGAYRKDLAYIHDVGYGDYALQAAPGVLEILRRNGVAQGLVVDLGCGSGLWARELWRAGYKVFGFDLSAAMLTIARQRVPEARFQKASFLDAQIPRCAAVTAIGEIFNYLFDVNNTQQKLVQFFERVYEALHPEGVFVFDVAEPGRGGGSGPRQRNRLAEDWAVLLETEEDQVILTRRITSFRRVGKLYRRDEEVHRLRLLRARELAASLRGLGFRARLLRGYGDFPLLPGMAAILARKP